MLPATSDQILACAEQNHGELGLESLGPQYARMLSEVRASLPAIWRDAEVHGKARSQFQAHSIDMAGPVAGPTKLRNARRLLAEIQQTHDAMREAAVKYEKLGIQASIWESKAQVGDDRDAQLAMIEQRDCESQMAILDRGLRGAVRKLRALTGMYDALAASIQQETGRTELTEADFEADEERFHIQKVFEQALCAARSMGVPQIDHGNYIYLHDLGINGRVAQRELAEFWRLESDSLAAGASPEAMFTLECEWLEQMAVKFRGCATRNAQRRGLLPCVPEALLNGDSKECENPNT